MIKIKIKQFFIAGLAMAVFMPVLVFGAMVQTGEDVFIKKGSDIIDNTYFAGENVSVNSAIFGDLLAVGGNVLVSNDVSEDIAVVGASVKILGNVGEDVRIVGGDVLITGDIVGDLVLVGGSIVISSDASIGGDLIVVGGQVSLDGDVEGDVKMMGGVVIINGQIKGNVKADIDEKLIVGNGAVIFGDLEYKAHVKEYLVLNEGLINGEILFDEKNTLGESAGLIFSIIGTVALLKLLSLIVAALIFVYLFRVFSNKVVDNAISNPIKMAMIGFAGLILIPFIIMFLFASLFGIPLALIVLFLYILLIITSCIYSGVIVGACLDKFARKSDIVMITWKNIIVGFVLLLLIKLLPFIGWIIAFGIFVITFGSIINIIHKKIWKK